MSALDAAGIEAHAGDIREMVREADAEFIPPLSARSGTTDTDLTGATTEGDVGPYVRQMLSQEILAAFDEDGFLAGVLPYIPARVLRRGEEEVTAEYVSMIIVGADHRRRGVARALYEALLSRGDAVATRTWAQNDGHLALLGDLGFSEWWRIPGDRGPGVDTVYLLHPGAERADT